MRWEDERYVKIYTRDTAEWLALGWEAQALFLFLLRVADRAGIVHTGRAGLRGLAGLSRMPLEVVERSAPLLLEDGCLRETAGGYVIPNFMSAQEARASDAQRKRDQRERDRAQAMSSGATGSRAGLDLEAGMSRATVTQDGHAMASHATVTQARHETSHAGSVTPSLAVPSRAEPSLAVPTSLPVADAPEDLPDATEHAVEVLVAQAPLLPAPEPVAKPPAKRRPAPRVRQDGTPTDARHAPLVQDLVDAYAEARGVPYSFRGRDARSVSECLAMADQLPGAAGPAAPGEVLRRWRVALRWRGYPACNGVHELAANWNAYAREQGASRPMDLTRGGVRAELFDHSRTGTVEDF